MNRVCTKCGISKPLDAFHKDKKAKDGHSSRCKDCATKHVKNWSRKKFADRYEKTEQNREEKAKLYEHGKKKCSKCGEIKLISEYYNDSRKKDGLYSKCKNCHDMAVRSWEINNPEKKSEIGKASKEKNREIINKRKRERWVNDKEFKMKELAIAREWKEKHSSQIKKYQKNYRSQPEIIQQRNESRRHRLVNDTAYKVEVNLRRRIIKALKGEAKSQSTMELLGCNNEEFIKHVESQFEKGMSWENYGYRGWHLDHIIPCAAFDLTDPDQQRKCFHFSNLQPMWWKKNMSKGAKLLIYNDD